MSKANYKRFIDDVKEYIIKCDLRSNFFAKKAHPLVEIVHTKTFDNEDPKQHELLISLILATGDMSFFAKPYLVARRLAENFYRE